MEELKIDATDELNDAAIYSPHAIHCDNISATWGFKIQKDIYTGEVDIVDKPTTNLRDISFTADKRDLVALVGPVGSGKSTLLAMLMDELEIIEGDKKVNGRI